jgi:hypothetical protein
VLLATIRRLCRLRATVRDTDFVSLLGNVTTPTLVSSSDTDASLPWKGHGEILVKSV